MLPWEAPRIHIPAAIRKSSEQKMKVKKSCASKPAKTVKKSSRSFTLNCVICPFSFIKIEKKTYASNRRSVLVHVQEQ